VAFVLADVQELPARWRRLGLGTERWRHTGATRRAEPQVLWLLGKQGVQLASPLLEGVFNSWFRKQLPCLRESSAGLGPTASRQSCGTEVLNGTL